ncbi:hypothetical protein I302_100870 [Kwoniella bestiolae CBS 10118]|uniref:Uncharacterized protein n=1 Tax=Kwoniella bestiolae CBS 10118 TaxID=1296100 RepID=A0A1B9G6D1_9TREE|nr:hypothetical protein I302_04244 [Kwoniella bestiolae CBS 10118]OCF26558.1 hypothetical protein I302_04244 [Kwoniella bestiolae CBS 10118]
MSTHPTFVNQTPFLPSGPIASSSKNTTYSNPSSIYASSSTTHSRTQSSTSVNTLASDISTNSTQSTSSTSSSFSRSTPIDRECLRWMQRESDSDHIFGSVSSRGNGLSMEEREVRRRAMEHEEESNKILPDQSEEKDMKAIKAERRKGRVGKWY